MNNKAVSGLPSACQLELSSICYHANNMLRLLDLTVQMYQKSSTTDVQIDSETLCDRFFRVCLCECVCTAFPSPNPQALEMQSFPIALFQ